MQYKMLKSIIRNIIPYWVRKRKHYLFDLKGKSNEYKIAQLESAIREKEKVKVLFIASSLPMWRGQGVYDLLDKDPEFDVRIIISPFARYNQAEALLHTEALKKYFADRKLIVPATTDTEFNFEDWFCEFSPDIIFFSQQYYGLYNNLLNIENHRDKLHCFIPYALPTVKEQFVYNSPAHNLAWRVYHATSLHLKTAKKQMGNNAINVRICGEPDADSFLTDSPKDPWNTIADGKQRKRIIWAPHFSIGHSGFLCRESFLWLSDAMVALALKYADSVQFAFKPHPHLHSVLSEYEGWGAEKTNEYYKKWATMPNTQLEEGRFQDLFFHSDGMIHDCGSFTGVYLYVNKPVMFMSDNISQIRRDADDFGLKCIELHYGGKCVDDVERFIKDTILGGHDPMREQRENFYNDYLLPQNGLSFAENVYNDLKNSLRN